MDNEIKKELTKISDFCSQIREKISKDDMLPMCFTIFLTIDEEMKNIKNKYGDENCRKIPNFLQIEIVIENLRKIFLKIMMD